jgi:membrane protease YdiL (CAAX protease family)
MSQSQTKPSDTKNPPQPLIILAVIAVFFVSLNLRRWLVAAGADFLNQGPLTLQLLIGYLIWVVPPLLTLLILYDFDFGRVAAELGLRANAGRAILLAFLFSLPMMIGYPIATRSAQFNASIFFKEALFPGVFEEFLFRGFLIAQLFKSGRLGFLPSVLIGAVAFGLGHLYQGGSFWILTGIVLVTALGSGWFSWLFIEWGRNLYLVMALHAFMNLWWSVFNAGDNALGGATANVFRFATVAAAIVVTIIMAKKTGFRIKGSDWILAPLPAKAKPSPNA